MSTLSNVTKSCNISRKFSFNDFVTMESVLTLLEPNLPGGLHVLDEVDPGGGDSLHHHCSPQHRPHHHH